MTVIGDGAWLADPARVYPVYLDPTLNFGTGRSGGGMDSYVTNLYPNSNFNVDYDSTLGRYNDRVGYYDSSTGTNYTFLYYDLSFLNGRHILSSTWNGYWIWSYYASTWTNYELQPVTGGWNAGSITWNNMPGWMSTAVAAGAVRNVWTSNDVTSWVTNWTDGAWGNGGVNLNVGGNGQTYWKRLSSDENNDGTQSYIQVNYNTPPSVSNVAPANGASFHNLTPTLSAAASDADGDPVLYWFRVALNPDAETNVVYDSQKWVTSSSVTLPATLPQNTTYYWHVYAYDTKDVGGPSPIWSFTPTNAPPSQAVAAAPADQAVVATATPQLTVNPSTDPEGDPITYRYRIATGPDGQSGMLVDSGKVNQTTWAPPAGALTDGGTYYWTAQASDGDTSASPPLSLVRSFRVELGLGDVPSRPYDRLGPVAVNLANGNVMVSTASPSFTTVGGSIGLSYTYNSGKPSNQGLTGYYFNDVKGSHQFDSSYSASVVRVDSQLNFDWNVASPYPSIGKTEYLVRWTGYVTVPTAGSYVFGTKADDGTKVYVNDLVNPVLSHWIDQPPPATPDYGTAITLAAGQTVPIKVEYYQNQGGAHIELWANGPAGASPVPASWFTTDIPGLPDGWSLSADPGNSLSYTGAKISDKNVAIVDSSGATHVFKWTGTAWAPPNGEDAVLTNDAAAGLLVLHAEDGKVYSFNSNGSLATVASALDDRTPAAPTYTLSGTPAVLTRATDPVSGKAIAMTYGGDPSCPSDPSYTAAPSFMLCKIDYSQFGGGQTNLYYANGHLARITDPGGEITDLGYDATGLLTQVRDPLSNDLIAAGTITDPTADTHKWLIAYTGGKATNLTSPVPDGGVSTLRPQHTYDYASGLTKVHVAGIAESSQLGYARQVAMDSGGRLVEDRDLAGKATKYEWDSGDRLTKKTDPTGIMSTTIYDSAGRPTDTYGPGSASEFAADNTSTSAPHSSTAHDGGINGLGAAWWDQTGLAGSPKAHTTPGNWQDWGSGSPAANIPVDHFSGRLTGEVNVTTPGTYGFSADVGANDGVRVYVDDWQVIDRWNTYQQAVLKDLPVSYWRIGDPTSSTTAADAAGSSAGTYNGGVTRGVNGALTADGDTAASFDGATGSNVTANNVNLPTVGTTMEAWVNLPDISRSGAFIQVGAGGNGFGLGVGSGMYDSTHPGNHLVGLYEGVRWIDSGVNIGVGWHHVAATIDGSGTATFFIDGAQVAQSTGAAPLAHGNNVAIGGHAVGGASTRWFHGTLDEVAVYGQVLAPPSIGAHYQAATARLNLSPYRDAVLADSPVAYYQLADGSGSVAKDEKGTFNGSYANSPTLGQPGKVTGSGAVVLNGTNQYMITPDLRSSFPAPGGGNPQNDTVTLESWFRANGPGVVVDELGGGAPGATWHDSQVEVLAGGEVRVSVWQLPWISVGSVGFGTWHHVALRYDQKTQQLQGFLDGVRADMSKTGSPSTGARLAPGDSGNGTFYALGAGDTTNMGSGGYFKGAIDEFAVYNQALTDRQIQTHYQAGAAKFTGGTTELTSGAHRIRIDYQNPSGPAKLTLNWTPPGGSSVPVPAASLKPRYGLVTTNIGADGKKTSTEYATPELGLATAQVVDPDPGGLNLRSTTTYEPVGTGFLRKTSHSLPKGPSSTVKYAYFGPSEVADNPCPGGATGINQGGMLKTSTAADPDGSGPQTGIVAEHRYDLAGKVVASRVVGDSNWQCTTYDVRERVIAETDSAGKTTTIDYSAPGAVSTSFVDSSGTTRTTKTTSDWLGRTIGYTDENGTVSRTAIDQAGRATDTYRQFSGQAEFQLTHVAYDTTTGREASITEYASGTGRVTNFTYDDGGRLLTLTRPNGVVTTNTFDPSRGWLNAISNKNSGGAELSPWSYAPRNPAGAITSEATAGRTRAFLYDQAGRLTQTNENSGAVVRNYSYDLNSNRCSTSTLCDGSYQYDNADRLLSSPFASSYLYDSHGNLTSATPTTQGPAGNLNQNFSFAAAAGPQQFPIVSGQNGTLSSNLSWSSTTPVVASGSPTGAMPAGGTVSTPVLVDGPSYISSNLTWAQGSHAVTTPFSASVTAGGTGTQVINPTATGDISASVDWNTSSTSGSWSSSVGTSGTYEKTITANGSGPLSTNLTWPSALLNPTLNLYLLDGITRAQLASSTGTSGNSRAINYSVPSSVSYLAPKNYILQVKATSTGSNFTLSSTYPVTANLDLELWSGSTKVASSYSTTAKPETVTATSLPPGSYSLKVISKDYAASYNMSATCAMLAYADLTLALKDGSGGVMVSTRSASGSTSLTYLTGGGGNYSIQITDNSSDTAAPTYSMPWSSTTLGNDSASGQLAGGGTTTRQLISDGPGYISSNLTWAQGSHPVTTPFSASVTAGGTGTQVINPTATGDISASVDWNTSSTSGSWSSSVGTSGTYEKTITANGSGPLSTNLTWPSALLNPTLNLYLLDGATRAQLASSTGTRGNSRAINYSVPSSVSYSAPSNYILQVKATSTGSNFTLSSTYPVTANLDLELWSGSTKVASSYSTTAKPETITATSLLPGSYSLKVISKDYAASYNLSATCAMLAYADLTFALKDATGATITSVRSATGNAGFTSSLPAAGGYSLAITDNSPDIGVPSYTLSTTLPKVHQATATLSLKDSSGNTIATDSGVSPRSISVAVGAGQYTLVVTPLTGSGNATLSSTYPGRVAKEVIGYDANDHAKSIDDGTNTTTETLAPSGRVLRRIVIDDATSVIQEDITFGYDGAGDSAAYSRPTAGGTVTTYVEGPAGLLVVDLGGTPTYPIANAHGDFVGVTDATGAHTANPPTDEFGVGQAPASRLGWLGAKARFSLGGPLGLIRMGVRLYDPSLGRFLEADPVEGGSANNYDYAYQDPCNKFDLTGERCFAQQTAVEFNKIVATASILWLFVSRGRAVFGPKWANAGRAMYALFNSAVAYNRCMVKPVPIPHGRRFQLRGYGRHRTARWVTY